MGDEGPSEPRAKRQKKDKFGRVAAFQRLKELKGSKNKCEVNNVDDVYETVDEKEYYKRVVDTNDDWIVDDGTGYFDDGRDIFDDDLDSESIATASKNKGTSSKKKKKAVSEQAGKGNLQQMLSNMSSKKKEDTKLGDDDILSELISEIDSNEPGPSRKSFTPTRKSIKLKSTPGASVFAEKQAAKDYMKSFSLPKKVTPAKPVPLIKAEPQTNAEPHITEKVSVLKEIQNTFDESVDIAEDVSSQKETDKEKNEKSGGMASCSSETTPKDKNLSKDKPHISKTAPSKGPKRLFEINPEEIIATNDAELAFEENFDFTEEFDEDITWETAPVYESESAITEADLLGGWETMQEGVANTTQVEFEADTSDLPMVTNEEGVEVLRFFWWDAFESPIKPGIVTLFGKVYSETAKAYVSCCVVIRNIERKIYLLPRTHHLGDPSKAVSLIDVYHEFNNTVSEELNLKSFKSRKVTKNYCFDPSVPAQSEYLEVKYSASNAPIDEEIQGKTFSRVFGLNSSFLEMFLLERKIKGPCWLDILAPEPVSNPISWCQYEVNVMKSTNICVTQSTKLLPPPPLVVAAINMKTIYNPKSLRSEIVMLSCLVHTNYCINKQAPNPLFEQHFCALTKPRDVVLPLDIHSALGKYKATKVQKMDSERAMLNYFLGQFSKIDPDLIVGHDLQGYQINILCERMMSTDATNSSRLSKIRRRGLPKAKSKQEKELFTGRLLCDLKISAKELIKSRSYDLGTLCQTVLKIEDDKRMEIEPKDVPRMYQNSSDLLQLVSLTMQDTAFILKMMYELNVIPLALQITNIAGNVMSRTLMGGRSQRNEFLLLHAFYEKDYIVPDKAEYKKRDEEGTQSKTARKKPTYSGGLVLDPKVGFYDKLILLMDFNSLYPSIIQEYNICFTTIPDSSDENIVLPDSNLPPGILPTEIRKLVESRRGVKQLMKNADVTPDLKMQYHIRQMALKLTANSMYGCLGFSNSRFFAKGLAALVTLKGREILVNTRDLVQKMCFEVIYGDTDSIMINTNCLDYDQVFKVGSKIKQEVNKLYKQVELDIDGVFKYLLLLKKKKYAAVTLSKDKNGELITQQEYKGLDIVRRDWSQLAAEAGKFILNHILSEQTPDERIDNIHAHLIKLKEDLEENRVPLSLLVITKQLTKDPKMYADKNSLPHVQVALRYNQKGGKLLRAGDIVPYVICQDGTNASATQRAYHVDELKNSETLKIDTHYYMAQQIHPVVTRLCEPIEGTDSFQIANCLGLDTSSFKKPKVQTDNAGENIKKPEIKFRNVQPFIFKCVSCKTENKISALSAGTTPFLLKCINAECEMRPVDYLPSIINQLKLYMRSFIEKYYLNELTCEDPACTNDVIRTPFWFAGKYPVCTLCEKGVMYRKYSEGDLYQQLSYFQYIFDLSKLEHKPLMEESVETAYLTLKECVENTLKHSAYGMIKMSDLFPSESILEEKIKEELPERELLCIDEEEVEDDLGSISDEFDV